MKITAHSGLNKVIFSKFLLRSCISVENHSRPSLKGEELPLPTSPEWGGEC